MLFLYDPVDNLIPRLGDNKLLLVLIHRISILHF